MRTPTDPVGPELAALLATMLALKLLGRCGLNGGCHLGQTRQRVFALPATLAAQQAEAGKEILDQPLF